jgi:hypothetical protein
LRPLYYPKCHSLTGFPGVEKDDLKRLVLF